MSFETALRSRLKAAGAVTAIVAKRIDWDERPQRSAYPAVVLEGIADPRPQHMKNFPGFRETRVQINCLATASDVKVNLREAVIAALVPEATLEGVTFRRAFVNNVIPRNENTETGFVHRDLVDMSFWHDA